MKKKEITIGFEALKKMTIQDIIDMEKLLQFDKDYKKVKNGV